MAAPAGNMEDGLNKLLKDIAQMAALPDSDLDFLTKLQMVITAYMRQGGQANQDQGQQDMGAAGPAAPVGGPPPSTGAMGGAMQGMGMPNPDELRRMLATQSGGQGG